jgi:LysM repeat protein
MGRRVVTFAIVVLLVTLGFTYWLGYRYGRYVHSGVLAAQVTIPNTEIENLKSDMRLLRDKNADLERRLDEFKTQKTNIETAVQELEKKVTAKTIVPGSKYRIRSGDTLSHIAQQAYGEASWYEHIAKVNHIHDPDYIREGLWITLPPLQHTQNVAPEP